MFFLLSGFEPVEVVFDAAEFGAEGSGGGVGFAEAFREVLEVFTGFEVFDDGEVIGDEGAVERVGADGEFCEGEGSAGEDGGAVLAFEDIGP